MTGTFCQFISTIAWVLLLFVYHVSCASSFDLNQNDGYFTFTYSTSSPNSKNWIGVYKTSGGGPVDEKFVEESLVWGYAPSASGTVHIPAGNLVSAQYRVFFLSNDGYKWLTDPKTVSIPSTLSSYKRQGSNTFSFSYSTTDGHSKNWIGIYKRNLGPVDGLKVAESIVWEYAPGNSGTVRINADALQWGEYRAFYLQRDGYRWLAPPQDLNIAPATGSLSWNRNSDLFTFDYTTSGPSTKNWIGVYPADGGPVNQIQVEPSLLWSYAPGSSGTVTISAGDIPGGNYKAFFLARDEYMWITNPINISVSGIRFPVKSATVRNARRGTNFDATVGGLVVGDTSNVKFTKISGDTWVQVGIDGRLSGMPNSTGSTATVIVRASNGAASAELTVVIPVRDASQCMVQDIRMMTYNLWYGGTRVRYHHEKQLRAILASNIDVMAIQEGDPNRPEALAKALGWYYHSTSNAGRTGVISRYPIVATSTVGTTAAYARIALDGTRQQLHVWATHLTAYPYGPYAACNMERGYGPGDIMKVEEDSGRVGQIKDVVAAMSSQIASRNSIPVFLMGDFNAPSHLDWVSAHKNKNCGISSFQWPSSRVPTDAGLIDSFRKFHPDPVGVEGNTWSPINPYHDGDSGGFEPQDRIDFVYYAGNVQVTNSQTYWLGKPAAQPNHESNEWSSDHAAVLTSFRINSGSC